MENLDRLRLSLGKSLNFFKEMMSAEGLWSDFITLAGESPYWVSGYVGYALALYSEVFREDWLRDVGLRLLEDQSEEGGWGYGPGVPPDADSTSWCLLFLSRLERMSDGALENALKFLMRHQNESDGGFRTYATPDGISRYIGMDGGVSFEGWCTPQTCVTAVAAQVLIEYDVTDELIDGALGFLKGAQNMEGFWEPYWWSERLYATFNSMKAFARNMAEGGSGEMELLERAEGWIAGRQLEDGCWSASEALQGSAFSTSLALRGLMLRCRPIFMRGIHRGVEWLLDHQLPDGSWGSHHILRIPHPSVREPWKQYGWRRDGRAVNALIRDHNRLYTTATALSALSEYWEILSEEKTVEA